MIKLTEQQYARLGIINDELQNTSLRHLLEEVEACNHKLPKGTVPIKVLMTDGETETLPGTPLGKYWYITPAVVRGKASGRAVALTHISGYGMGGYKNKKLARQAWVIFSKFKVDVAIPEEVERPPQDEFERMQKLSLDY